MRSLLERPSLVAICNASWPIPSKSCSQRLTVSGRKLFFSSTKHKGMVVLSAKTSEAMETSKFDGKVLSLWPKIL